MDRYRSAARGLGVGDRLLNRPTWILSSIWSQPHYLRSPFEYFASRCLKALKNFLCSAYHPKVDVKTLRSYGVGQFPGPPYLCDHTS